MTMKRVNYFPASLWAAPANNLILATTISILLFIASTSAAGDTPTNRNQLGSLRGGGSLLQHQKNIVSSMFPPLSNCERNAAKSPFRLFLDAAASRPDPSTNLQRFCFRISTTANPCNPKTKCCDASSARTVSKVEFDVVAACKESLRQVTINGQPASYEYDTTMSVLRVTGLNAADAEGMLVCVALDATSACPSLSQFCTRPNGDVAATAESTCRYAIFNSDRSCCPVAAVPTALPLLTSTAMTSDLPAAANALRSGFPYCQCQRDAADSRLFATASSNVTVTSNGLTRICFDVGLREACPNPASKCCEFTLYKMELEVDHVCAEALAFTTIDGVQRVRYFQTAPHAAIKIVNLDKPISEAKGTQVCLFLRPECNTLTKLCSFHDGSCTVGLFSRPGGGEANCCPLSSVRV
ncbi:hypothetical protein Vretimale_6377 [Volvox reticuliferus]|uniref:Pherophorin domain-containing protein n=1 Tax=Volvox reticuliferus TaxID=1737510 RepID=A0A8J4G7F1_9CHLO|nr:hypothetical protein Vretifemale_16075 [Volvox reticuliferus]GIM01608.1 hypothetical protein Vretimale_6377 [Volvox reticuliferus]